MIELDILELNYFLIININKNKILHNQSIVIQVYVVHLYGQCSMGDQETIVSVVHCIYEK